MATLDKTMNDNSIQPEVTRTRVLKVYLLDRQGWSKRQSWLSVVRSHDIDDIKLFLHEVQGYRPVSLAIGLSLLSRVNQMSLWAIVKRSESAAGSAVNEKNCLQQESDDAETVRISQQVVRQASAQMANDENCIIADGIFDSGALLLNIGRPLFRDQGNALATHSNSVDVAQYLVRLAQARGWNAIRVTGSETFRHAVWVEANARGLRVRGYGTNSMTKAGSVVRLAVSAGTSAKTAEFGQLRPVAGVARPLPIPEARADVRLKPYRAKSDESQYVLDVHSAYEQAVVMARIYENLSQQGVSASSMADLVSTLVMPDVDVTAGLSLGH